MRDSITSNGSGETDPAGNGNDDLHEVLILDPDHSAHQELGKVLKSNGYKVRGHQELDELVQAGRPSAPSCLLLGAGLHGDATGLEVLEELRRMNWRLPTVVTAAQWDVGLVVKAMRAGAVGFVPRPFEAAQLMDSVRYALNQTDSASLQGIMAAEARERVSSLNARELEVVRLVMGGCLNKEIAQRLDLALVTVKVYRARAMTKLGAGNPAELVHVATLGGLEFKS